MATNTTTTQATEEAGNRSCLGSALLAPFRLLGWPFRQARRRIAIQLIYSHVIVVALTILAIEIVSLIGLFFIYPDVLNEDLTDYSMVSTARTGARLVDLTDVNLNEPLSPEKRALLEDQLDVLVGNDPTGSVPPSSSPTPNAMITNESGTIIASTSDLMFPTDMSIAMVNDELAINLTLRLLELRGQPSGWGNPWVIDSASGRTAVAYPLMEGDDFAGVLTIAEPEATSFPIERGEIILGIIGGNLAVFLIVTGASFFIAVPVGIWMARRISSRVTHLAEATEAMGAGELEEPIQIRGEDEIARLGQRFNQMFSQVSEAERQRRAFLANISHELRTPIAVIQGNLDQLIDKYHDHPETAILRTVRQEATTLNRLIDDLFTLARLEEAQLPLEPGRVDLHQLASQIVENLRTVAWQQSRISVESMVSASTPLVLADRTRLRQILVNLLYNAIRHTPEGGMVVVQAEERPDDVAVSIHDTGIGIPPEEIERVFDRFHQVERSGRHQEGSGLGLAIVKQLVEAQGGEIHVESEPGQGTIFTFTIPKAPSDA